MTSITEQWECVATLAGFVQLVCLADLDQQIYEFRHDVSPDRIKHIVEALKPLEVPLGAENNRNPGVEIVAFANDILAGTPRGAPYKGVSHLAYRAQAEQRDAKIRGAVGMLFKSILAATGKAPRSVGYLTNWGKGVVTIARALQGGEGAKEIRHRVVMDEADVLLATRVVALLLEPVRDTRSTLGTALELMSDFYRGRRGKTNVDKALRLAKSAADARAGNVKGNAKCPKILQALVEDLAKKPHVGNPAVDWLSIRKRLEASDVEELRQIAQSVMYLMGFNRGRRISDALAEVWQRKGCYEAARALIEAAVTEDLIIGGDTDLVGINVMTMHKSKGKEFDGVILLHVGRISPFSMDSETPPHIKSRRLLRVGITRAKKHVLLLTDAYTPSPLLGGHALGS